MAQAALQQVFSHVPHGADLDYLFQRHVNRSLPTGHQGFDQHVGQAVEHWRAYLRHGPAVPVERAASYAFGVGWDVVVPVALWGLGFNDQTLVDSHRRLRLPIVNQALQTYRARRLQLEDAFQVSLRPPLSDPLTGLEELTRYGIRYLAPRDARATGLPTGSVDLVTSTFALEHIPPPDLLAMLVETRRLLRRTGVLSCSVDMQDHYSYVDRDASAYSYLRFSELTWRLVNPHLHYQNRLRYPEYHELLGAAGFGVVDEEVQWPTAEQLDELQHLPLAAVFRCFSPEEVGVRAAQLVARPAVRRERV